MPVSSVGGGMGSMHALGVKFIDFDGQILTAKRGNTGNGRPAGGIGAALFGFLDARMESGILLIMQLSDLERKIAGVDLVFTGEGKRTITTQYIVAVRFICPVQYVGLRHLWVRLRHFCARDSYPQTGRK